MQKKFQASMWTVMLIFSSSVAYAEQSPRIPTPEVCPLPSPLFQHQYQPIENLADGAIGVRADRADIDSISQLASYFGNVEVQVGEQQLHTEQAQINQLTGNINASGATLFNNGYVQVSSENFRLNSGENRAFLSGAQYQLVTTGAHGKADLLSLSPEQVLLEGSTFTTCPSDNPAWQLSAQQISLSEDEEWGEAWHAKFELFGVPVFYMPYINFPVTDARKTGFLFPTFGSSQKNGFEVEIPYYINIAPNMDMTVAPRYMAERGAQLQVEFRMLHNSGYGQYNVAYLADDKSIADSSSRYLWRIEQAHYWGDRWRGYVNGTFISDDDYLNDFGSDFAGRADSQLYRHAQLDYHTEQWQVSMRVEDFELLGSYRSPYRTVPQIKSYYSTTAPFDVNFTLFSELSHFQNQDFSSDTATRIHIEPQLSYHLEQPGYDWLAELSYAYTYYNQDADLALSHEKNPSRSLPTFRWRGRVNLEREVTIQNEQYTHTLQPQIQYLYIPYRNQSGIGIYDATLMQDDYQGLFRARRFTGLDRIADANQVTIGASTSLFDQQAREMARVSFGQIYYFENSRTQLFNTDVIPSENRSDLALESRFRISDNMYFNNSIQYNLEDKSTRKSQTTFEYRLDEFNLVQLSHRTATNLLENDVEQVGMLGVVELSPQWQLATNWYYDLQNSRTNDAFIALQYSDCCWAMRISGYRRINRNLELYGGVPNVAAPEFDNGISIQFIIKGLGRDNRSLLDMIEQSLFGYRHPFHLSN